MSKFRSTKRKHYYIGTTWYIGSGNNLDVFTKRPKPSFSKIKEIYGEHLEKSKYTQSTKDSGKVLSPELRSQIKERIRKEGVRARRKQVLALFISFIILGGLIFTAILFIRYISSL